MTRAARPHSLTTLDSFDPYYPDHHAHTFTHAPPPSLATLDQPINTTTTPSSDPPAFAIYILRQVNQSLTSTSRDRLLSLITKSNPSSVQHPHRHPTAHLISSSTFCTISSLPQSTEQVAKYHRRFHFDDESLMATPTPGEMEMANYFGSPRPPIKPSAAGPTSAPQNPPSAPAATTSGRGAAAGGGGGGGGGGAAAAAAQQQQPKKFHPRIFIVVDNPEWETEGLLGVKLSVLSWPPQGAERRFESVRMAADGAAGRLAGLEGEEQIWEAVEKRKGHFAA